MKFLAKTMTWVRRSSTAIVFLSMLVFLVLSHTTAAISEFTTGAIRMLTGVATVSSAAVTSKKSLEAQLANERKQISADTKKIEALEIENKKLKASQKVTFRGEKMTVKAASERIASSVQARTKKAAAANLASVAGESIPLYGIAIVVGATGYELKVACDTMTDMYDLELALNPNGISEVDRDYVCGLQVPTKEEIWISIQNSPATVWSGAVSAYDGSSQFFSDLEVPDFSGQWSRTITWLSSWFE